MQRIDFPSHPAIANPSEEVESCKAGPSFSIKKITGVGFLILSGIATAYYTSQFSEPGNISKPQSAISPNGDTSKVKPLTPPIVKSLHPDNPIELLNLIESLHPDKPTNVGIESTNRATKEIIGLSLALIMSVGGMFFYCWPKKNVIPKAPDNLKDNLAQPSKSPKNPQLTPSKNADPLKIPNKTNSISTDETFNSILENIKTKFGGGELTPVLLKELNTLFKKENPIKEQSEKIQEIILHGLNHLNQNECEELLRLYYSCYDVASNTKPWINYLERFELEHKVDDRLVEILQNPSEEHIINFIKLIDIALIELRSRNFISSSKVDTYEKSIINAIHAETNPIKKKELLLFVDPKKFNLPGLNQYIILNESKLPPYHTANENFIEYMKTKKFKEVKQLIEGYLGVQGQNNLDLKLHDEFLNNLTSFLKKEVVTLNSKELEDLILNLIEIKKKNSIVLKFVKLAFKQLVLKNPPGISHEILNNLEYKEDFLKWLSLYKPRVTSTASITFSHFLSPKERWKEIKKLYGVYIQGYTPVRNRKNLKNYSLSEKFTEDAGTVKVYYNAAELTEKDAAKVTFQREPGNIEQSQLFDSEKLKDFFLTKKNVPEVPGLSVFNDKEAKTSSGILFSEKPHTICIYSKTPFWTQLGNVNVNPIDIFCLSVPAPSLDTSRQPHFGYYMKDFDKNYSEEMKFLAETIYQSFVDHIDLHKRMVLTLYGQNNFLSAVDSASKEKANGFYFEHIFEQVRKLRESELESHNKVPVVFYCYNFNEVAFIKRYIEVYKNQTGKDLNITIVQGELSACISEGDFIVNAWDPHSIVGNGNDGDRSLDGVMGASTGITLLQNPWINTLIGCDKNYNLLNPHLFIPLGIPATQNPGVPLLRLTS